MKPGDLKSYNDLLNPRWKEKIIFANPTLYRSAFNETLEIMGLDFLKKLVEQRLVIVDDEGLGAHWLAHGKYPIAVINRADATQQFITAGAPIKKWVPQEGVMLAGGGIAMSVVNRAPPPQRR
ncbi:MAG: hypothetical protein HY673_10550 [Chloroflexi bacterium]|nr:hypothetical protein [Chloroflexota bacterium]